VAKKTYKIGSRVRVRLYSGEVVEAEVTAVHVLAAGPKVQIVFGQQTADQTIEVVHVRDIARHQHLKDNEKESLTPAGHDDRNLSRQSRANRVFAYNG
jgi:hypothetical protein